MAYWGEYVSAAERRAQLKREKEKLRKQGLELSPVTIEGRLIARSFWGKSWCRHLESFSDYSNRLPRGRTYARNGSVCHLEIQSGRVEAIVAGTSTYRVKVHVNGLPEPVWERVKMECAGQIGSLLELLQGRLSQEVMAVVCDRNRGLFPKPKEIEFSCTCPDWARMCKHVAAVLYGVGNRLDLQPELLFLLRGLEPEDLIATELSLPSGSGEVVLPDEQLADIFGIDLAFEFEEERAREKFDTGQAVAVLRERLGLSVREFALELGVTAASVYRWESSEGLRLRAKTREALEGLAARSV